MQAAISHDKRIRAFSLVNLLLGAWLVLVPFVFAERSYPLAASAVIAGALVMVSEGIRYVRRHTVAFSWLVVIAGTWLIAAPWVFNAHSPGARTWNYVIGGIVVAGIAAYSITSSAFRHPARIEGETRAANGSRSEERARRTLS